MLAGVPAMSLVPTVRLELTRLSPPPPQDGVSTNSTTSATAPDFGADSTSTQCHASLAQRSTPALSHHVHLGMSPALLPEGAAGISSFGASFAGSLAASCGTVLIRPPLLSLFGSRWLVPL